MEAPTAEELISISYTIIKAGIALFALLYVLHLLSTDNEKF